MSCSEPRKRVYGFHRFLPLQMLAIPVFTFSIRPIFDYSLLRPMHLA